MHFKLAQLTLCQPAPNVPADVRPSSPHSCLFQTVEGLGDKMWCFNFSDSWNAFLPHPFIFWRFSRSEKTGVWKPHHCLGVERQPDFTLSLKIVVIPLKKVGTAAEQLGVLWDPWHVAKELIARLRLVAMIITRCPRSLSEPAEPFDSHFSRLVLYLADKFWVTMSVNKFPLLLRNRVPHRSVSVCGQGNC